MRLPLYNAAQSTDLKCASGNLGLHYTKFADAWRPDLEKGLVFAPPVDGEPSSWFEQFNGRVVGENTQLAEAAARAVEFITRMGGRTIGLKNTHSRFVTGMGLQHPTENGFAWHHTLAVPYLSGSGVKGAVAAYAFEQLSDSERKKLVGKGGDEDFGHQQAMGGYVFTDLLPIQPVRLVTEVMTPHYGPYYQDGEPPADWHSPVPIQFLAVDENQSWMCGVIPVSRRKGSTNRTLDELQQLLLDALEIAGGGAKTQSGFGRFEHESIHTDRLHQSLQAQHAADAADLEYQQALAKADPQERTLIELSQGWIAGQDEQQRESLIQFLDDLGDQPISEAAAHWIRDNYLEVGKKGIWKNPRKTQGKKNKAVYSVRKSELTERIQKMLQQQPPSE